MAKLSIPYDRGFLLADLDDAKIAAILSPRVPRAESAAADPIEAALRSPLSSPSLAELARGKRRVVVVTADRTRPLPSAQTLPQILAEIRRGNPSAEVAILIGTGTHRPMTRDEMEAKFGPEIVRREHLVCHRGDDPGELGEIGRLPSGVPIEINRLAAEADLLIGEGFIEPHFFAGFSGGPKCVLPGIAGHRTIRANHSGPNIDHPKARTGILDGNPIYAEMEAAADLAHLAFILNVVLGKDRQVAAAFAGDWRAVHIEGTEFVRSRAEVPMVPAPIAVTSNGGYPLDQNLYQAVKGMTAAEAMTTPGGRIIIVAGCIDGLGGEGFARLISEMSSPAVFCTTAARTPAEKTPPDLWEAQILARILRRFRVTLVSGNVSPEVPLPPGLTVVGSLAQALADALAEAGPGARVTVIPDGVGVIPR